jgi:putative phage-type endonuclease
MQQRSKEWFLARCGKFTASGFSKLIGKNLTATAKTYILEKIVETHYGIQENHCSVAMQWGIGFEPEAAEYYELLTGSRVQECGFIQPSENSYFGGSPDGLIGESGLIEIKCPHNPVNHLRAGLCESAEDLKKLSKDYYWQCYGNMLVTGRKWCDFVSFDPRLQGEARMYVLRIERDETILTELSDSLKRGWLYREELRKKLGL